MTEGWLRMTLASAFSSVAEWTAPDGLEGELSSTSFVRSVSAAATCVAATL